MSALIILAGTLQPAVAASDVMPFYLTGDAFLELCHEHDSECIAYIVGVVDTALLISASTSKEMRICIPQSIPASELRRLAVAAVHTEHSRRHLSPAAEIAEAIAETFPCE